MANLRVTRVQTEVAGSVTGMNLRVTRVHAEVAGTVTGNTARLYNMHMNVLADADGGVIYNLTASSALSLTQSASVPIIVLTASNTLSLVQSADAWAPKHLSASNALALTELAHPAQVKLLTGTGTLSLTQSSQKSIHSVTAFNELVLSDSTHEAQVYELTASSQLSLTQSAVSNIKSRTAYSQIELTYSYFKVRVKANGVDLTAQNALGMSQTNNRYVLGVGAIPLTATSALSLTARAFFPIELTASGTLSLTQLAAGEIGKSASSELDLTHVAAYNLIRSYTASNALQLAQVLTYELWRNGVQVGLYGECKVTEQYSPFGGGSAVRSIPYPMERHSDVLFYYPSGSPGLASLSVTLRSPNFGDRDRNQYSRINRESRGGSLTVYRDPKWPSQRTLVMDFSGICDTDVTGIIDFLDATLGVKVGFRDWQGRLWSGIIVTPDAAVVRNGLNRNDIALELEVDDAELWVSASNSLTLTQGADAEVL